MSNYQTVIIETYSARGAASSHGIRARPLLGQNLDTAMNVECSSKMRKGYPVGTKFLILAKITSREGGKPFLYSHFNQPYEVISTEDAEAFIRGLSV